jgi:hypothetical protein
MRTHHVLLLALSTWLPACGGSAEPAETTTPATTEASVDESTATPQTEAVGTPSPDRIPRTVFFGNPDKASPKLSPDGKQLAYLAEHDGVLNVWVAPITKLDAARAITADKTRPVRSFLWAYDNEHMLYMQDAGGDENWHVFSVEVSTGKTIDLTPMKKIAAQVCGVSDKHPTKVVIGINDRNPQLHDLYTVDITSGEKVLLQENPGFIGIGTDDNFKVRYAMAMAPDGGFNVMVPKTGKSKASPKKAATKTPAAPMANWEPFMVIPQDDALTTNLLGFDKSGKKLYLWESRGRDRSALMLMDMKSKKQKLIAEHDKADGEAVGFHPTTKKAMAVSFNCGPTDSTSPGHHHR